MICRLTLILSLVFSLVSGGAAQTVDQRLAALERDVTAIKLLVDVPATQPAPAPSTTQPAATPAASAVVRCDTVAAMRQAVATGARSITTKGVILTDALDLQGASVELIDGAPSWQAAFELQGYAELSNATIVTHDAKAIVISGKSVTVRNVTFAPGGFYSIHAFTGRLLIEGCTATTMRGYWLYLEPTTHADVKRCSVVGGSGGEALMRAAAATYVVEDSLLDASLYGEKRVALRGDSPGTIDAPGGIVRRSALKGSFGPNPLADDDGGQMMGIDRWRIDGAWITPKLLYQRSMEQAAVAKAARAAGKTPAEIVRITFASLTAKEREATGRQVLSERDVALTLAHRAAEIAATSSFLMEDSVVRGELRVMGRTDATIRRSTIDNGSLPAFAGNSQPGYPWPLDRSIVAGEAGDTPRITFEGVELKGSALGLDLRTFVGLTFVRSTLNGQAVTR